jgi:hypothetical protein
VTCSTLPDDKIPGHIRHLCAAGQGAEAGSTWINASHIYGVMRSGSMYHPDEPIVSIQ